MTDALEFAKKYLLRKYKHYQKITCVRGNEQTGELSIHWVDREDRERKDVCAYRRNV